jgi:hypothetical protein
MVVAGGLGGGLMIANTMNPKAPAAQTTKLERRASEPSPSPSPSPNSGAAQAAMTAAGKDVPAQAGQDGAKIQAPTQSSAQSKTPSATATATNVPAASEPGPAPSPSSAQAMQHDAHDKPGTPDAAFAKARAADLRTPDADTRRNAQKRQTRNHQQWAERRRMQRQPEADPRDAEQALRDDGDVRSYSDQSGARGYRAENRARVYPDDGNARRYQDGSGRDYAAEPVELELPRIRLFDGF